jgi:glycopeptide antibiotics resistance protein
MFIRIRERTGTALKVHLKVKYRIIAATLFLLYLSYLVYLTFFSHRYGRGYVHRSINLHPFRTIAEYAVASYNRNIIVTNLFGNIAAFAPLGFLLPLIGGRKAAGVFKIVLAAAGVSVAVETFQYLLGVGAADIDDVILNTVGGILGYLALKLLYRLWRLLLATKARE